MTHRARTTQQIIDAASQGSQFPCGSIADHYRQHGHKHTCWKCEARRAEMTEAHKQGYRDAQERALLYDTRTLDLEITNSTQAYCDVPPIEPAVSYIVGYTNGLQAIYDSTTAARKTA